MFDLSGDWLRVSDLERLGTRWLSGDLSPCISFSLSTLQKVSKHSAQPAELDVIQPLTGARKFPSPLTNHCPTQ
jgi:hypothetical protein